jgi:isoamylase
MRNILSTLLLSQGTPMLLAGDEFGRTQQGNNNAYCQDNEISWVNWNVATKGRSLINFVQRLTEIRHQFPILRRNRFLTGIYNEELGIKDLTWIHPSGEEMQGEHWKTDRCFGMLIDGRCQPTGLRRRGSDATLLIVFNSFHQPVPFAIPNTVGSEHWSLLLDTSNASSASTIEARSFKSGDKYEVAARSLQLFVLVPDPPIQASTSVSPTPYRRE